MGYNLIMNEIKKIPLFGCTASTRLTTKGAGQESILADQLGHLEHQWLHGDSERGMVSWKTGSAPQNGGYWNSSKGMFQEEFGREIRRSSIRRAAKVVPFYCSFRPRCNGLSLIRRRSWGGGVLLLWAPQKSKVSLFYNGSLQKTYIRTVTANQMNAV